MQSNKLKDDFFLSKQVWCVLSRWKCEGRWNIVKTDTDRLSPSGQRGETESFKNTSKAQTVNKLNKGRWMTPQPRAIKGPTHCKWSKRSQQRGNRNGFEFIPVTRKLLSVITHLYQKPLKSRSHGSAKDMHVGGWHACVDISACEDAYVVSIKHFSSSW